MSETTSTVALVAFLRARIDEDEQDAKGAAEKHGPHWQSDGEYLNILDTGGDRSIAVNPWGATSGPLGPHIARHDPARVLREVEAKRATISDYEYAIQRRAQFTPNTDPYRHYDHRAYALYRVLLCDAAIHADHPDYKAEEWAP